MKNLFIILLSIFVLSSCESILEKKAPKDEIEKKEEIKADENHYSDKDETIALNDGEKWVVNEEMKPNVLKGEETLN